MFYIRKHVIQVFYIKMFYIKTLIAFCRIQSTYATYKYHDFLYEPYKTLHLQSLQTFLLQTNLLYYRQVADYENLDFSMLQTGKKIRMMCKFKYYVLQILNIIHTV